MRGCHNAAAAIGQTPIARAHQFPPRMICPALSHSVAAVSCRPRASRLQRGDAPVHQEHADDAGRHAGERQRFEPLAEQRKAISAVNGGVR